MFHGFHVRFPKYRPGRASSGSALKAWRTSDEQTSSSTRRDTGECSATQEQGHSRGGAKGVILATPEASTERVVKALGNTLLDLNLYRIRRDDLIYLGPDENITDALILWLVQRAAERGHPVPNAFMSFETGGAGINHKEYGVTSNEEVVVFWKRLSKPEDLEYRRERPFSIKMTGGPDGDVARNALKIMHREFGTHPQVVAIADGTALRKTPWTRPHRTPPPGG